MNEARPGPSDRDSKPVSKILGQITINGSQVEFYVEDNSDNLSLMARGDNGSVAVVIEADPDVVDGHVDCNLHNTRAAKLYRLFAQKSGQKEQYDQIIDAYSAELEGLTKAYEARIKREFNV